MFVCLFNAFVRVQDQQNLASPNETPLEGVFKNDTGEKQCVQTCLPPTAFWNRAPGPRPHTYTSNTMNR